jgi:uncharacterized protein (DUF736 family)
MAYEQKDLTFSLFKQNSKAHEKSPDYSGTIKIDGKEMRLAGWIETSKSGLKYINGKVSEIGTPKQGAEPRQSISQCAMTPRDLDNEAPF